MNRPQLALFFRSVAGLWLFLCLIGVVQAQNAAAQAQARQLQAQAGQLEAQKQYAEAAKLMRQAVQLVPKDDQALGYLAKLEYLGGEYGEATDHAVAAAKLNPKSATYHIIAMKAASKNKNPETAKKFAENVIKLKVTGDYLKEAKEILAQAETQKAEQSYFKAIELHRLGDVRGAMEAVVQAKTAAPEQKDYSDYLVLLERLAATHDLDVHARKTGLLDEDSFEKLSAYLLKPAKSDGDKARVIFTWICDRIEHDVEARRTGKADDVTAKTALATRRATPEGYANLFAELARSAKLEVEIVKGHAKGPGFQPDQDLMFWKHVWNAVKIGDKWQLVDCYKGAGDSFNKFDKKFRPFYFCPLPETLIYSHFPEDEKWLMVEDAPTVKKWQHWPTVETALFDLGAMPAKVREYAMLQNFRGFVRAEAWPGPQIYLHAAPLEGHLRKDMTYSFKIEAIGFEEMVVSSGGKFIPLKKTGKVFEGAITAAAGNLFVSARVPGKDLTFRQVLTYEVE